MFTASKIFSSVTLSNHSFLSSSFTGVQSPPASESFLPPNVVVNGVSVSSAPDPSTVSSSIAGDPNLLKLQQQLEQLKFQRDQLIHMQGRLRVPQGSNPLELKKTVVTSSTQTQQLDASQPNLIIHAPPLPPGMRPSSQMEAVKSALSHAWQSYEKTCFGRDELAPLTNTCKDWVHSGLTIIDAMPTLWIMGMKKEFSKCRDWVRDVFKPDVNADISFFETVIRVLGGLLSAFDLSRDPVFLTKATALGDSFLAAFDTPSGMPYGVWNPVTKNRSNHGWAGGSMILAEVGTIQLEFTYLSMATGNPIYAQKVQKCIDALDKMTKPLPGLYPILIRDGAIPVWGDNHISMGALGDSFYEYLLKMWLLGGKKNDQYRRMYTEAALGIEKYLYVKKGDHYILAEMMSVNAQNPSQGQLLKMDHLACFSAGMFALGAHTGAVTGEVAKRHMEVAHNIAETCVKSYKMTASGIGPENFSIDANNRLVAGASEYHLRPETVESLFILWRATHNQIYRNWGWDIFQALERHCRHTNGYVGLANVNSPGSKQDKMESFLLAEVFKYLYLLFAEDDLIPLEEYLFNTEAHPLRYSSGPGKNSIDASTSAAPVAATAAPPATASPTPSPAPAPTPAPTAPPTQSPAVPLSLPLPPVLRDPTAQVETESPELAEFREFMKFREMQRKMQK